MIGVSRQTLYTWIESGHVTPPKPIRVGRAFVRLWKRADIDRAAKAKGTLQRGPRPKAHPKPRS